MFTTRRRLTFGTEPGGFIGPDGMARSALRRQRPIVQTIGTQMSALADALVREATILNDYGTPTFARASTAYDPYNAVTAISGARRRRSMPISRTLSASADLIEGARTNLILQSQAFATTWTTGTGLPTIVNNSATAPDGTATASLFTEGTTNGNQTLVQSVTKAASAIQYTTSVYVKLNAGTDNIALIVDDGVGNGANIAVNAATGAILQAAGGIGGAPFTAISGSAALEGTWVRVWITALSNTATTVRVRIGFWNGSNFVFAGSISNSLLLWGAQLEAMPASSTTGFASSYIATTTIAVTRARDDLTISYAFSQSATRLALCIPYGWTGDQDGVTFWRIFNTDDTASSGSVKNTTTIVSFSRSDNGGTLRSANFTDGLTSGQLVHLADTNTPGSASSGFKNGVFGSGSAVTTGPFDANTVVKIGGQVGGGQNFFGWVALLTWTRALSASELYALYASLPSL